MATDPDTEREPLRGVADAWAWAMVEASPDGMLLTDEEGVILLANSRLVQLFGIGRSDLVGRPVEELIPARLGDVHRAHRAQYRARPTTREMGGALDLWAVRGDGSEFPVEVSLSPLEIDTKQCIVATVRDITERRAAEADRRAVLSALDSAHDGIFMFDAASLVVSYVNQGAIAQVGYSRDELLTMTPLDVKPEYTEAGFREMIAPLLAGTTSTVELTTIHRHRDGSDVPVEVDLVAPTLGGGDSVLIAIARDVSDRLLRETAEAEREISMRLLRDRERLARDLHDLVVQRLFGAGMGLQSVQSLIDDEMVRDRLRQTISDLDQAIAELRTAIFRLTQPADTSLRDSLERVVSDAAGRMNLEPVFVVHGELDSVPDAAGEHLVAVLTEALSNVVRHAEATEVSVELTVSPTELELIVQDDGKGMGESLHGHGLANLERRAIELAGSVTVTEASALGGTKVHWIAQLAT